MRGFVGRQSTGDLGQGRILEGGNHPEVGVGGAQFQARGQAEDVVLALQRVRLERLGVFVQGFSSTGLPPICRIVAINASRCTL